FGSRPVGRTFSARPRVGTEELNSRQSRDFGTHTHPTGGLFGPAKTESPTIQSAKRSPGPRARGNILSLEVTRARSWRGRLANGSASATNLCCKYKRQISVAFHPSD